MVTPQVVRNDLIEHRFSLGIFMEKVEAEKREKHSYAVLTNEPDYKTLKTIAWDSSPEHPKAELLKQIVHGQLLTTEGVSVCLN